MVGTLETDATRCCCQVPGILPIQAEEWYTCYIIEESLSMDNLFAFYMVFLYFKASNPRLMPSTGGSLR